MDEKMLPPLICEQCGEHVWPTDSYKPLAAADQETGEPTAFTGKVVHDGCWDAWEQALEAAGLSEYALSREYARLMARQEWRRKVIPSCLGQAQEAVAQLRSRGIRADLQHDAWLVFDLRLEARADPDAVVAEALDRIWPAWRECVTD